MPDLALLIATVAKTAQPAKAQEPTLPTLTQPAAIPQVCEVTPPNSSSPENALDCPEFSPVATTASRPVTPVPVTSQPITSQPVTSQPVTLQPITTRPVTPLPILEPSLPGLGLPSVAANPYLPQPEVKPLRPQWTNYVRPRSGSQLYQQRLEALRQGKTYTRLAPDSFSDLWASATQQPTHEEWIALLKREATAMSKGQGTNRLTVVLGDSISQWLPIEELSSDRFYLNQGISGDTTAGVLNRLSALDQVRPNTIYVMVGVNDLKNGKSDAEILTNLQKIMQRLHQSHPQAQVIINSILPTRWENIPSDRVAQLNQQISLLATQESVGYLALTPFFADDQGILKRDLTTDGLHLSAQGYAVWGDAMRSMDAVITARLSQ